MTYKVEDMFKTALTPDTIFSYANEVMNSFTNTTDIDYIKSFWGIQPSLNGIEKVLSETNQYQPLKVFFHIWYESLVWYTSCAIYCFVYNFSQTQGKNEKDRDKIALSAKKEFEKKIPNL